MGLALFFISLFTGVIIHELAHALAFNTVGGIVLRIKIGKTLNPSRKPLTFSALGFRWEVYSFPLAGVVHGFIVGEKNYRTRRVLAIAAGPVANFLLILAGLLYFFFTYEMRIHFDPRLESAVSGWVAANIMLFMVSAIPGFIHLNNGPFQPTDGFQIIRSIYCSQQDIHSDLAMLPIPPDKLEEIKRMTHMSIEELIEMQKLAPNNLQVLHLLILNLRLNEDSRAYDYSDILLRNPNLTDRDISRIIDETLTARLLQNTLPQESRADSYSQRLLELSNHSVTARGTRGAVLIDLGRIEEGKALLNEVLAETKSVIDQEFSLVFLSIAEERLGNFELAERYAAEALAMPPKTRVRLRILDQTLKRFKSRSGPIARRGSKG